MKVSEIRKQILKKLGSLGQNNKFIEMILSDTILINGKDKEPNNSSDLNEVIIHGFSRYLDNNCKFWKINLEKEMSGLSTNEKKCEALLIFLKEDRLNVFMIEIKTTIDDGKLNNINSKLNDTLNRFLILLILNNEHDTGKYSNLELKFYGVIFYNLSKDIHETKPIHKCFRNESMSKSIVVSTEYLNEKPRVKLAFFKNKEKQEKMNLDFQEILNYFGDFTE